MSSDAERAEVEVGALLEMLEMAIDRRARAEVRQEWLESEEHSREVTDAVTKALHKLMVSVTLCDETVPERPRGFGFRLAASSDFNSFDFGVREVTLERLLDVAREHDDDEYFDVYLDEMEHLLRKYGRLQ